VALLGAAICTVGACRPKYQYQGERGIVGTYSGGTLSANLPEGIRVPTIVAAAESMFRDRGYTIVESSSTEDAGQVIARPPRFSTFPRMEMTVQVASVGTTVLFSYRPVGNQELSRASLDALLRRLGL
jgi:hypothetical protein